MNARITTTVCVGALLVAAAGGLSGCSSRHLSPDFGYVVHEDLVAQIADPQPHPEGKPAPGAIGTHVAAATFRYETGVVIQPVTATTSKVGGGSGASSAAPTGAANGGPQP